MPGPMTDAEERAQIQGRFARAIDAIHSRLPKHPKLAKHMRTCAEVLRLTTVQSGIVSSVVFREIARGLRSVGGDPRCVSGRLTTEWIDEWLTEIERRA